MKKKILVIDNENQANKYLKEVISSPSPDLSNIEMVFIKDIKGLEGLIVKDLYAVILLYVPVDQPEIELELINTIRFQIKELNARIIAVFDRKLTGSIEEFITRYPIDGYISGNDLSRQSLEISLMLAIRNHDRIKCITEDYERTRLIKRFSPLPSQFNSIGYLIDTTYQKLLTDPHTKSAAVFHDSKIIKCSGDETAFLKMYKRWETSNSEVVGSYIFLQIREFENYVLAIESISSSKETDYTFSMDLIEHAIAVRESIIDLVKNDRLLLDLYMISTNISRLIWIEAKGRKVNLHLGKYGVESVNQQLKTILLFFGEDYLLQINRSILVNTGKIRKINRLSSRNLIIEMTTGEVFSVSRLNIKKVEELFKDRLE